MRAHLREKLQRRAAAAACLLGALGAVLFGCAGQGPRPARPSGVPAVLVEPRTGLELVLVPGGHLGEEEGFDAGQGRPVRLPAAEVTDLYVGRSEVTQAQWEAIMGRNPSRVRGAQRPVEQVSWDDAAEFTRRLGALAGRPFRLPAEAEWRWAYRGGRDAPTPPPARGAQARAAAAFAGDEQRPIAEVGRGRPNALGLFDLGGNASEWCQDPYSSRPAEGERRNGPDDGYRVLCGAAWEPLDGGADGAYRLAFDRVWVGRTVGFRVVAPANPAPSL